MNIIPFSFESYKLRAATDARGNPVFVAADVAKILGYKETTNLLDHCKQSAVLAELNKINSLPSATKWIPESDLYRATLKSNMPGAERVQDWVCEDVLPTIRKTGAYIGDIDSIEHLPPALAKQVGGIVKGIVHKELGQAINDALAHYLPDAVNSAIALRQISTRRGITAGQVMTEHGLTKIRNGDKVLSGMLCKRECLIEGAGRAEMGNGTAKLFDPDKVRSQIKHNYLREQYESYVKTRKGQGSLFAIRKD